jgi:hypothetical protein
MRANPPTVAATLLSQPTSAATATSALVAVPTVTPAAVVVSAAGATPAAPSTQPVAVVSPTAAQVARAVSAPVAQKPALQEAPSRVNGTPGASRANKNVFLLVGGAMSLLIAAAVLLEWRRRAPRP